ncbi:MAG: DUF4304 domain-containing protein [Gammaproteobacteria bacterium]|nr:DUF4304 domain-containing protein [Gammaproteobacteria bacterium]
MKAKEKFFEILKEEFSPKLREIGFKGSGQNFRRIYSPLIHTINIQGNKYGDSCCVNLGIHLEFLPITWSASKLPDINKIKGADCEFRKRLAPNRDQDYWWKYKGELLSNTTRSARSLIETYRKYGEPGFQNFKTVDDVLGMLSVSEIEQEKYINVFGGVVPVRGALTMARIYSHVGNVEKSVEFAKLGLKLLGRATALRSELERLASAT